MAVTYLSPVTPEVTVKRASWELVASEKGGFMETKVRVGRVVSACLGPVFLGWFQRTLRIRAMLGGGGGGSGKTRTKDKYRVVYTDHQRLELEKEFHYSRYITLRRKSELAASLGLTERQVKIWFQNRRAKERKVNKKKQQPLPPPVAHDVNPAPAEPPLGGLCPGSSSLLGASSPAPVKEEFLP
ncbi:homeobox protein CDX-1 [Carlito syrichta]|uniref:Homeobox protein CDX-1 n=1 Tax=Carlito syrichta TaxID=1868482 RepID=A0A3Q0E6J1_CARSF|nr:homeobox protein CDX-1 [Carlito syrichta]